MDVEAPNWQDPLRAIPPAPIYGQTLDGFEPRPVRWLSRGRIAAGKLTMFDADGGLGKSTIVTDIAARLTTGRPLFAGNEPVTACNVVLVAPEDSPWDTLTPRLLAAGGDPRRVRLLNVLPAKDGKKGERALTIPEDCETIREVIEQDGARLLILDPITSLFGRGVDTNNDTSVRIALRPLLELLEVTGCACIAIRHIGKRAGDKASHRGLGSVAFSNLARTVLTLSPHPFDPDRRTLAVAKINLGRPAPTLSFRLVDSRYPDVQAVAWDPAPLTMDADTLARLSNNPDWAEIVGAVGEYERPLAPSEIATALGMEGGDYSSLRHKLSRMLRAGLLITLEPGKYALPYTARHSVTAVTASQITPQNASPEAVARSEGDQRDGCDAVTCDARAIERPHTWSEAFEYVVRLGAQLDFPRLRDGDVVVCEPGRAAWRSGLAGLDLAALERAIGLIERALADGREQL